MPERRTVALEDLLTAAAPTDEWVTVVVDPAWPATFDNDIPPILREENAIPDTTTEATPVNYPYWWSDEFQSHCVRIDHSVAPRCSITTPGMPGYGDVMRAAFEFFRQHADRRYSDNTLMSLLRHADANPASFGTVDFYGDNLVAPVVFSIYEDFTYDEETEVKTGGTIGMIAAIPNGDGMKAVLAVRRTHRRKGVARALFNFLNSVCPDVFAWVANTNVAGQHFLLEHGFIPAGMSTSGALRFAATGAADAAT